MEAYDVTTLRKPLSISEIGRGDFLKLQEYLGHDTRRKDNLHLIEVPMTKSKHALRLV